MRNIINDYRRLSPRIIASLNEAKPLRRYEIDSKGALENSSHSLLIDKGTFDGLAIGDRLFNDYC